MELDLWIPQYRIGLEYQGMVFQENRLEYSLSGEHHYFNLNSAFGSNGTSTYLERDLVKASFCEKHGITLVNIPYWCGPDSSAAVANFNFEVGWRK